jgi:methyltransferase (TIGR00027 family)
MTSSRTARYVALYRALESSERTRAPLFEDPYAPTFLPCSLRLAAHAAHMPGVRSVLLRYADHKAPGARTSAIARTRFIDDQVRAAVTAGFKQFVLLGAGFDSRALRMRELQDAHVFEVDKPATQITHGVQPTAQVHYVGVDFQQCDDIAAELEGHGFDRSQRSLFIWEGVTNYLDAASVERTLASIGRTAVGSRLVFTYVHRGLLDGSVTFDASAKPLHAVRRLGEPWSFGLDPREVPAFLSKFRLVLEADLGADTYRRRYLHENTNGLRGYGFYRLATAHVVAPRVA